MSGKTRVVVGLSGGVDSSVAAYLLCEAGYEVVGVFMRNWHDDSVIVSDQCPWIEDSTDAMMVADKLGIPFHTLDFSEVYRKRIVDYMFAEYEAGRTPNPDVLCNREIKFDVFVEAAEKLGASFVATGHYCQKGEAETPAGKRYRLLAGADQNKDQSYFLCQLTQEQLSRALFPIGGMQKDQVRAIARRLDLVTADKRDSQGLCFIGKVHLPVFLQQQLKPRVGEILLVDAHEAALQQHDLPGMEHWPGLDDLTLDKLCTAPEFDPEKATKVGTHQGAHFFTIGQRKGLDVGGMKEPIFVISTDIERNIIFAGMGGEHPGLLRRGLFVRRADIHWIRDDLKLADGQYANYQARIRYRQPLDGAMLIMREKGLYILFDSWQKGIAAGQFVAWYQGEECIGSGVISAGT